MGRMDEEGGALPAGLSTSDINTTINHEPRIHDLRLGEALGFGRPRDIRPLIERHREALERFGGICGTVPQNRGRGRPANEYWLNKKQAVFITLKAETERATEIAIEVVEVFDAATSTAASAIPYQGPAPLALPLFGQELTTAQIFHPAILAQVEQRARELAEASIPRLQDELVRVVVRSLAVGWNLDILNEHFKVSILRRYKPGSEDEANFLIGQWVWEMVPDTGNVAMREALKAAITPILRGEKLPVRKLTDSKED